MAEINVEIKLHRDSKIYHEGDLLTGTVHISSPYEEKHDGILLSLEGAVNLHNNSRCGAILEPFYNNIQTIVLLDSSLELASPGKLLAGTSEFHFELPLTCNKKSEVLYETYYGMFIDITYQLRCEVKRTFWVKSLEKVQQFCIQSISNCDKSISSPAIPNKFRICSDAIQKQNSSVRGVLPRFLITGQLDQTDYCITKPITGEINVEYTETAIKTIQLQLIRIESFAYAKGFFKESSEVQALQIVDGNVCTKMPIAFFLVLPRLFTCPTLQTKNFRIEFEMNIVVIFKDEYIATENFKIAFKRMENVLH